MWEEQYGGKQYGGCLGDRIQKDIRNIRTGWDKHTV